MKYVLRISSKSIITTFPSNMHIPSGCYWNFYFLIKVVSSCGIVFTKCKCFSIRFRSKRNRNLTFSRCYAEDSTKRYVWSINIIHDRWKRWRKLALLSFFKLIITLYIIITISLITVIRLLAYLSVFLSVRSFH